MKKPVIISLLIAAIVISCKKEVTDIPVIEPVHLTSFVFDVDDSKGINRYFQDYTVNFTVEDESCGSWSLQLPPQSGETEVPVRVAPLVNIQGESSFGTAVAGLALEPSGLELTDPLLVTVHLETGDEDSEIFFFMTDAEGRTVDVPVQSRNGNEYLIKVTHFSNLVGIIPAGETDICPMLNEKLTGSLADAQKAINPNPVIPVEPVSYEFKCDTGATNALRVNIRKMMEPERTAIANVLQSHRSEVKYCQNSPAGNLPPIVNVLLKQLVTKAVRAIKDYSDKPDKFTAVSIFALASSRQSSLLGGADSASEIFRLLQVYMEKNIAHYKKKIREEHDLQYLNMLARTYREMSILGSSDKFSEMLVSFHNLIRFKLEAEIVVTRNWNGNNGIQKDKSVTTGSVIFKPDTSRYSVRRYYPSAGFTMLIDGLGTFTSEGESVLTSPSETLRSNIVSEEFYSAYTLELNLCEYKGKVSCWSPGNDKEKWTGNEALSESLMFPDFTNTYFNMLNLYGDNEGLYPFTFKNRQEVLTDDVAVVSKTIDGQQIRTEFHYRIIHFPK